MEANSGGKALGGRWLLDAGRPAGERDGTVHLARPASSGDATGATSASVELYRLPSRAVVADVVAAIERAAALDDPRLLRVLDVGVVDSSESFDAIGPATIDQPRPDGTSEQLYVVTERWDTALGPEQLGEAQLREVALVLTGAIGALHRADIVHGCVHRGAIRRAGGQWKIAHAGMAAVLAGSVAPYRPPGLHVMEPTSPAADMWNVGVVLHELGTGRLHRAGAMPRVEAVPVIDYLVRRLLVAEPGNRLTATDLVAIVENTPIGRYPAVEDTVANVETFGTLGTNPDPAPRAGVTTPGAPASRPVSSSSHEPAGGTVDIATSGRSKTGRLLAMAGLAVAIAVVIGVLLAGLLGDEPDVAAGLPETEQQAAAVGSDPDEAVTSTSVETDDDPAPDPGAAVGQEAIGTGPVALAELQPGDCVTMTLAQGVVDTADRVSCDEAHVGEIVAVGEPPTGAGADYPGRAALLDAGDSRCVAAFEDYVGAPLIATVLNTTSLVPSFGQWESGDLLTVSCLVTRFDGRTMDRSVAGGAQRFKIVPGTETAVGKIIRSWCFEPAGQTLSASGKRQDVTVVACTDLHRYEVVDFMELPVEDQDETGRPIDPGRYIELARVAESNCDDRLAALGDALPNDVAEATVVALVPDVDDWQLGDRYYQCVMTWPEPVLGSVSLAERQTSTTAPADE